MDPQFARLRALLREMFQFDQADLDFGIYRILNLRRRELGDFLDRDLLPQVEAVLGQASGRDDAELGGELERLLRTMREAGMPEAAVAEVPRVKELRARLAGTADVSALAAEVYSHLATFFGRYYKEGDFLSLPRYKEGVYAIPYSGEEVKLHWANADQYYVKTAEHFRDYAFRLADGRRVRLRLVEASTEGDNNKAAPGRERRFALVAEGAVVEEGGELACAFTYAPREEKQKELNAAAEEAILAAAPPAWRAALGREVDAETGRTELRRHLDRYTARNTFDYFIHKDLGGFLRRELDFYVKNEVLFLDDIEGRTREQVDRSLALVKAVRKVGGKVVDLLAQVEDFQKKLFLKKKLVLRTDWCVTLDRVPRALYPEVAANARQVEEWRRLFDLDGIPGDLFRKAGGGAVDVAFLEQNPHLVVDTAFFDRGFVDRLLAEFTDLEGETTGVLVRGENFQALGLMHACLVENVSCVVTDPPYNTGNDGFMYRDGYSHSSWLSMISDRFAIARMLLADAGASCTTIDSNEHHRLALALQDVFGPESMRADIAWQRKYAVSNNAKGIAPMVDHVLVFSKTEGFTPGLMPRTNDSIARYQNPDNDLRGPWKPVDYWNQVSPDERPNLCYPITNPNTGEMVLPTKKAWKFSRDVYDRHVTEDRIWWGVAGTNSVPALKLFLADVRDGMLPNDWWPHEFGGHTDGARKELEAIVPTCGFSTPKPARLFELLVTLCGGNADALVLDFFAGSGTTGHAVLNLNRQDGGRRRFILVEVGEHFDTVLKPRLLKVVYSKDWKDGRPVSREGTSAVFKVLRLESYEDALDNLELRRDEAQQSLLDRHPALAEDYRLRYLLDVESRGSLLDLHRFRKPWDYTIRARRGEARVDCPVDLVETFNYLLGLRVRRRHPLGEGLLAVEGTAGDARVLVLWRDGDRVDDEALSRHLRAHLDEQPPASGPDLVYVNGDHLLGDVRRDEETWKVRLVEEEFHRLMFAGEG